MSADQIGPIVPLVLIAGVFWLLILRPARRRQQDAARLQRSLGVGDRVMLTSGVFGTVTGLEDESFQIEVAPGVVLTVHRQAVAKVVEPAGTVDGPTTGSAGSTGSTGSVPPEPDHGDGPRP